MISLELEKEVQKYLGRVPRGLKEIVKRNQKGEPSVLRVSSLVEKKPFPTLYWLVDLELNKRIDRLESTGIIQKLENQVLTDTNFRNSLEKNHLDYIKLRLNYMDDQEKKFLISQGFFCQLQNRGIGGISDFSKIRCLHMHYAYHLIYETQIGNIIDDLLIKTENPIPSVK